MREQHQKKSQPADVSPVTPELSADSVQLLSIHQQQLQQTRVSTEGDEVDDHPLRGSMSHSRPKLGLLRSNKGLAWRHRLPEMAAMLRLRATTKSLVRAAMHDRGYLEVSRKALGV